MRRLSAVLVLALAALACTAPSEPERASLQVAAAIELEGGAAQRAPVTLPMPDSVVARVTDTSGNPVEGRLVNFEVAAGAEAGTFDVGALTTNGRGRVFNELRAGTRAWTARLWAGEDSAYTARLVSSNEGRPDEVQSFTFAVDPGEIVKMWRFSRSGPGNADPYSLPGHNITDEHGNPGLARLEVDSVVSPVSSAYGHPDAFRLRHVRDGTAEWCLTTPDSALDAGMVTLNDGYVTFDRNGGSVEDCR